MTKQRQLVLSVIQQSEKHLSAEEVYRLVKERLPSIVLATVYNNLNALTEQNMIQRVNIHGQRAYYDKNIIPHDHVVCDCCGEIKDIAVGNLLPLLRERSGIAITSYQLNLHYICEDCREKQENE